MVNTLLVFAQLLTTTPAPSPTCAPTCAPSRRITRAVRAHCDRTDGDWRADLGCEKLWAGLRTCDPNLTITRRRDRIVLSLEAVGETWTMWLERAENTWQVTQYSWEQSGECPAEPWSDPRAFTSKS